MRRLLLWTVPILLGISACSSNTATTEKAKATKEERPLEPCHPGCFPAGTMVATPEGLRPIETLRCGELVMLVNPDGTTASGIVDSCFQTCNRLVEVQTDSGNLLTTETQPLCLRDGGFRRAGELADDDVIWRWEEGERRPTRILAVVPTGRDVPVFNLVVGEGRVFVAGGFLARGKPPHIAADSSGGVEPVR